MADIDALMRSLPLCCLEREPITYIKGLNHSVLGFISFEAPPAGQRAPYIDPEEALTALAKHHEIYDQGFQKKIESAKLRMHQTLDPESWVHFYDAFEWDTPACIPVPLFLDFLRAEHVRNTDSIEFSRETIDFLQDCLERTVIEPLFDFDPLSYDIENSRRYSLIEVREIPPPEAMIEYVPLGHAYFSGPWTNRDKGKDDWDGSDKQFFAWRDSMRPIAERLGNALGEPVYDFSTDLYDELQDDYVHRFILLHWCCTYKPESSYVHYLIRASRAKDVEDLKATLLATESYKYPFRIDHWLTGNICAYSLKIPYWEK